MQGLPSVAVVFFLLEFSCTDYGKNPSGEPSILLGKRTYIAPPKKRAKPKIWGEARKNSTGFFLPQGPWFHQSFFHRRKNWPPKNIMGQQKSTFFDGQVERLCLWAARWGQGWGGDDGGSWSQLWARKLTLEVTHPVETNMILSGQIIATSHDLTPNGSWERGKPPSFNKI